MSYWRMLCLSFGGCGLNLLVGVVSVILPHKRNHSILCSVYGSDNTSNLVIVATTLFAESAHLMLAVYGISPDVSVYLSGSHTMLLLYYSLRMKCFGKPQGLYTCLVLAI